MECRGHRQLHLLVLSEAAESKVAKVANFCASGFGDLAGQKLVSKVATLWCVIRRLPVELIANSLLPLEMNSTVPHVYPNLPSR
jgi:hypothetical protein